MLPQLRRPVATVASTLMLATLLPLPTAQAASAWSPAGNLAAGRSWHTATVLADGVHVLVAGGLSGDPKQNPNNSLSSAELFDATTQTWRQVAPMVTARGVHAATLLNDGSVLEVGGRIGDHPQASAERFDPAAGTWSPAGELATPRSDLTATLLQDGRVLVAGGLSGAGHVLASAELYDPSTGSWSQTGSLASAREDHTATLLPDGRVLVVGGDADDHTTPLASAELYDPATGQWTPAAALQTGRLFHTATLVTVGDGTPRVLVMGGQQHEDASILASTELYDPSSDSWSPAASMSIPREDHATTMLPDGSVVVSGGQSTVCATSASVCTKKTVERYDPQGDAWTPLPDMGFYRNAPAAVTLADGRVLVVGGVGISAAAGVGRQTGSLASAEWFTLGG